MTENIIIILFIFATGACIGSFLNVVALRALSKESIVLPSSKCPKCNTPIKWYDNIPILSYFFTIKGKCRSCGEKVSIQYPLVEALTALSFVLIYIFFGFSIQSLLLLILLSVSTVIIITDIRKEYVYDVHSWIFIITALIYSFYTHNIHFALIGLIFGAVIMEVLAKLSYYLVQKKDNKEETKEENIQDKQEEEKTEDSENKVDSTDNEEEFDINVYIKKYKRAFGEGDTYLAAGAGALLGLKMVIPAIILAIIIQAVCILPQFILRLYRDKHIRLLISLGAFIVLSIVYMLLLNLTEFNIYVRFGFVILLIFFAIDTIKRLKTVVNKEGFIAIPFGPALLISSFFILFFGNFVLSIIKHHIFI